MTDLDRVRYLTRNYYSLQGLTRVPFGVYFLVAGLLLLWWPGAQAYVGPTTIGQAVGYVLAIALGLVIARAYARRFGRVARLLEPSPPAEAWLAVVWVLALLAAWLYDMGHPEHRVYLSYAVFSLPLCYWGVRDRHRRHYLLAGVVFAALGFTAPFVARARQTGPALEQLVLGVLLILTGIADHRIWIRGTRSLKAGDDGQSL